MATTLHRLITSTHVADCNGSDACRQNCVSTHRTCLRIDSNCVLRQIEKASWLSATARSDLFGRIAGFIADQSKRFESLLGLKRTGATVLCGNDSEIAATRQIVNTSVGILIPADSGAGEQIDMITHRRHVAASTLRHVEWHAQRAAERFADDAGKVMSPFRVTMDQVTAILDRPGAETTVMAIDPHGHLRRRWQDVRVSQAMVRECYAASACMEQFVKDHRLAHANIAAHHE